MGEHQRQRSVPEERTYVNDIQSNIESHFKKSLAQAPNPGKGKANLPKSYYTKKSHESLAIHSRDGSDSSGRGTLSPGVPFSGPGGTVHHKHNNSSPAILHDSIAGGGGGGGGSGGVGGSGGGSGVFGSTSSSSTSFQSTSTTALQQLQQPNLSHHHLQSNRHNIPPHVYSRSYDPNAQRDRDRWAKSASVPKLSGSGSQPLPPGWEEASIVHNGSYDRYFINHNDQTTTWFDPRIPEDEQRPEILQRHRLSEPQHQMQQAGPAGQHLPPQAHGGMAGPPQIMQQQQQEVVGILPPNHRQHLSSFQQAQAHQTTPATPHSSQQRVQQLEMERMELMNRRIELNEKEPSTSENGAGHKEEEN